MTKDEKEAFWNGFVIACRKMTKSPLWVAAHIFLFLICGLQNWIAACIGVFSMSLWAIGYKSILLIQEKDVD